MSEKKELPNIAQQIEYYKKHPELIEKNLKDYYEDGSGQPGIAQTLVNPNLTEQILFELDKKVAGERIPKLAIFLNACGMFVQNRNTASYNLMINSESGAGKDWVTRNVLDLFPKKRVHRRTRISPAAFTYWHNSKFEPEWTWNGKVVYLQDVSNGVLNCEVFKVMVSDGTHSTVVKDQRALDIEIKGKPVVMITTAQASPAQEMLRRFPIVNLDETNDQTEKIMDMWAAKYETGYEPEYAANVRFAFHYLKRVRVVVPYARRIISFLGTDSIIFRTTFIRFLDLIKASAALHQYQREVQEYTKSEGGVDRFIMANEVDYDLACTVMQAFSSYKNQIPLTRKQKRLLDIIYDLGGGWHKFAEIRVKALFLSERQLYRYLEGLQEHFLDVDSQQDLTDDGRRVGRPFLVYRIRSRDTLQLPCFSHLMGSETKSACHYCHICHEKKGWYSDYSGNDVSNVKSDLVVNNVKNVRYSVASQQKKDTTNTNLKEDVVRTITGFTRNTKKFEEETCVLCGGDSCYYRHDFTASYYCLLCAERVETGKDIAR